MLRLVGLFSESGNESILFLGRFCPAFTTDSSGGTGACAGEGSGSACVGAVGSVAEFDEVDFIDAFCFPPLLNEKLSLRSSYDSSFR